MNETNGGGEAPFCFPYSFGNKRYHTYDYYVKTVFGEKCVKIGLDGGFTCPNRDGTCGTGGCAFCARSGAETPGSRDLPLRKQYEEGVRRLQPKWGKRPAVAYFQANTSTYAPPERLRALYDEALLLPGVAGLTVATRPDALPGQVLDLLEEYSHRTVLTVELGLQTVGDETAKRMGRGYPLAVFLESFGALKKRGVRVCVHLINGLPGQSREEMLAGASLMARLGADGVKFHELYLRADSALGALYLREPFRLLSREEYVEILCDQIERLKPETVVERVTGDPERGALIAPLWAADKKKTLALLDKTLEKRGVWQGFRYTCTKTK